MLLKHSFSLLLSGLETTINKRFFIYSSIYIGLNRLVVRTIRCGRIDPGSTPGLDIKCCFSLLAVFEEGGK